MLHHNHNGAYLCLKPRQPRTNMMPLSSLNIYSNSMNISLKLKQYFLMNTATNSLSSLSLPFVCNKKYRTNTLFNFISVQLLGLEQCGLLSPFPRQSGALTSTVKLNVPTAVIEHIKWRLKDYKNSSSSLQVKCSFTSK